MSSTSDDDTPPSQLKIAGRDPALSGIDWNMDDVPPQEKNPFSLSEEEMSQLDAVLSSEEGKKILQETTYSTEVLPEEGPDILPDTPHDFDLYDANPDHILEGNFGTEFGDITTFGDHAYCAGLKERPVKSSTSYDIVSKEEVRENIKEAPKKRKEPPRRSTRITDKEQREQAEKIRQENLKEERKALRAMRGEAEESDEKGDEQDRKKYPQRTRKQRIELNKARRGRRGRPPGGPGGIATNDEDSKSPLSKDNQRPRRSVHKDDRQTSSSSSSSSSSSDDDDVPLFKYKQQKPKVLKEREPILSKMVENLDSVTISKGDRSTKLKVEESETADTSGSETKTVRKSARGRKPNAKYLEFESQTKSRVKKVKSEAELDSSDNDSQKSKKKPEKKSESQNKEKSKLKGQRNTNKSSKQQDSEKEDSEEEEEPLIAIKKKNHQEKENKAVKHEIKEEGNSDGESSEEHNESDSEFGSEDDPDRLWCICQKPHDNRFMICCDRCDDWFHGTCVGVSEKRGQEIQRNDEDWRCPPCTVTHGSGLAEKMRKERRAKKIRGVTSDQNEEKERSSDGNAVIGSRPVIKPEPMDMEIKLETLPDEPKEIKEEPDAREKTSNQKADSEDEGGLVIHEHEAEPEIENPQEVSMETDESDKRSVEQPGEAKVDTEESPAKHSERLDDLDAKRGKLQEKLKGIREKKEKTEVPVVPVSSEVEETSADKPKKKKRFKVFKKVSKEKFVALRDRCIVTDCRNVRMPDAVFCSEECIAKHSKESVRLLTKEKQKQLGPSAKVPQPSPSERVIVFQRSTGKILTGPTAPTIRTLQMWLEKHPSFEVLQSSQKPAHSAKKEKGEPKKEPEMTKKDIVEEKREKQEKRAEIMRKVMKDRGQTEPVMKEIKEEHKSSKLSHHGPEPVRIHVRMSFRDHLKKRAVDADDILLSDQEIKKVALTIEEELFSHYRGCSPRYKNKYKCLTTSIKDKNNQGLFRKILKGLIRPHDLVRMPGELILSKKVAEWKWPEKKKRSEKSNRDSKRAPSGQHKHDNTSGKEAPITIQVQKTKPTVDILSSIIVDTTSKHDRHLFDLNCKICTGSLKREEDESSKPKPKAKAVSFKEYSSRKKAEIASPSSTTSTDISMTESQPLDVALSSVDSQLAEMSDNISDHTPSSSYAPTTSTDLPGNIHMSIDGELAPTSSYAPTKHTESPTKSSGHVPIQRTIRYVPLSEMGSSTGDIDLAKYAPWKVGTSPSDEAGPGPSAYDPPWEDTDATKPSKKPETDVKMVEHKQETGRKYEAVKHTMKKSNKVEFNWKGFIEMPDVSRHNSKAHAVSGNVENLQEDIGTGFTIVGRIGPSVVWDYLKTLRAKCAETREITVIRFEVASDGDKTGYSALFSYLNSRNRCGVVGGINKVIKDMYLVPLPASATIPAALMPFSGPGLPVDRSNCLLGIVTRQKSKKPKYMPTYPAQPESPTAKPDTKFDTKQQQIDLKSSHRKTEEYDPASVEYDPAQNSFGYDDTEAAYTPEDTPEPKEAPYEPGDDITRDLTGETVHSSKTEIKAKTDSMVSQMADQIAQSKNPVQITAAMVATLAVTGKLKDQQKLLLELTQKVEEQKKLLKQKAKHASEALSKAIGSVKSNSGASATDKLSDSTLVRKTKDPVRGPAGVSKPNIQHVPQPVPPPDADMDTSFLNKRTLPQVKTKDSTRTVAKTHNQPGNIDNFEAESINPVAPTLDTIELPYQGATTTSNDKTLKPPLTTTEENQDSNSSFGDVVNIPNFARKRLERKVAKAQVKLEKVQDHKEDTTEAVAVVPGKDYGKSEDSNPEEVQSNYAPGSALKGFSVLPPAMQSLLSTAYKKPDSPAVSSHSDDEDDDMVGLAAILKKIPAKEGKSDVAIPGIGAAEEVPPESVFIADMASEQMENAFASTVDVDERVKKEMSKGGLSKSNDVDERQQGVSANVMLSGPFATAKDPPVISILGKESTPIPVRFEQQILPPSAPYEIRPALLPPPMLQHGRPLMPPQGMPPLFANLPMPPPPPGFIPSRPQLPGMRIPPEFDARRPPFQHRPPLRPHPPPLMGQMTGSVATDFPGDLSGASEQTNLQQHDRNSGSWQSFPSPNKQNIPSDTEPAQSEQTSSEKYIEENASKESEDTSIPLGSGNWSDKNFEILTTEKGTQDNREVNEELKNSPATRKRRFEKATERDTRSKERSKSPSKKRRSKSPDRRERHHRKHRSRSPRFRRNRDRSRSRDRRDRRDRRSPRRDRSPQRGHKRRRSISKDRKQEISQSPHHTSRSPKRKNSPVRSPRRKDVSKSTHEIPKTPDLRPDKQSTQSPCNEKTITSGECQSKWKPVGATDIKEVKETEVITTSINEGMSDSNLLDKNEDLGKKVKDVSPSVTNKGNIQLSLSKITLPSEKKENKDNNPQTKDNSSVAENKIGPLKEENISSKSVEIVGSKISNIDRKVEQTVESVIKDVDYRKPDVVKSEFPLKDIDHRKLGEDKSELHLKKDVDHKKIDGGKSAQVPLTRDVDHRKPMKDVDHRTTISPRVQSPVVGDVDHRLHLDPDKVVVLKDVDHRKLPKDSQILEKQTNKPIKTFSAADVDHRKIDSKLVEEVATHRSTKSNIKEDIDQRKLNKISANNEKDIFPSEDVDQRILVDHALQPMDNNASSSKDAKEYIDRRKSDTDQRFDSPSTGAIGGQDVDLRWERDHGSNAESRARTFRDNRRSDRRSQERFRDHDDRHVPFQKDRDLRRDQQRHWQDRDDRDNFKDRQWQDRDDRQLQTHDIHKETTDMTAWNRNEPEDVDMRSLMEEQIVEGRWDEREFGHRQHRDEWERGDNRQGRDDDWRARDEYAPQDELRGGRDLGNNGRGWHRRNPQEWESEGYRDTRQGGQPSWDNNRQWNRYEQGEEHFDESNHHRGRGRGNFRGRGRGQNWMDKPYGNKPPFGARGRRY